MEIDTEVTQLLIDNASHDANLDWSKALPIGVSKKQHYEGFTEIIEMAKTAIYNKTQRFVPNYMLISSSILPVLGMIDSFKSADTTKINGPYFAGTLNGLKVYVTPNIPVGKFVVGVNDGDFNCSAAVI